MARVVSKAWQEEIKRDLNSLDNPASERMISVFTRTIGFNKSAQWLICELDRRGIPFKVYNLGAGVKKITTETESCPCCKRKF